MLWGDDLVGVVALPNGIRVRGRGLRAGPPAAEEAPDFGVYLTAREHSEPGWESRWVCWPDFRLPRSTPDAIRALAEAYDRAPTERVEIACGGGTGRTGTALAILARLSGVPADRAVVWVRRNYRPRAVE
ncbi:MAG: protein-tyrosine phosphatase family protein, partial [Glaciihabitans sp.]